MANGKYLTRENMDSFFTEVIPKLKVKPPQAVRYRTALQWYSKKIEYPSGGDGPQFIVDSEKVQAGINRHTTKYLLAYATGNHDAHAGLGTDVLTNEDHLRALKFVFKEKGTAAYKDFALSWTGCMATYTRQDTIRKLFLCHLRADEAHGPPGANPNNQTILTLILEPGSRKDDSAENQGNQPAGRGGQSSRAPMNYKKRVVGAYRHKNVLQCFTGMVAMSILMRYHDDKDLSFFAARK